MGGGGTKMGGGGTKTGGGGVKMVVVVVYERVVVE